MALTLTQVMNDATDAHYLKVWTVDFDNSYPTGGEPLTSADLGFAGGDPVFVFAPSHLGYVFDYDYTNKKMLVYRQKDPAAAGGADIALVEVSNTFDLSTLTGVRVAAFGKFK